MVLVGNRRKSSSSAPNGSAPWAWTHRPPGPTCLKLCGRPIRSRQVLRRAQWTLTSVCLELPLTSTLFDTLGHSATPGTRAAQVLTWRRASPYASRQPAPFSLQRDNCPRTPFSPWCSQVASALAKHHRPVMLEMKCSHRARCLVEGTAWYWPLAACKRSPLSSDGRSQSSSPPVRCLVQLSILYEGCFHLLNRSEKN